MEFLWNEILICLVFWLESRGDLVKHLIHTKVIKRLPVGLTIFLDNLPLRIHHQTFDVEATIVRCALVGFQRGIVGHTQRL